MIQVHFKVTDNQAITFFELTGHADAGPYGSDIVCAAVSATAIGTVNNLERLVGIKPIIESDQVNGGHLRCQLPQINSDEQFQKAQLLLQNLKLTLLDIEQTYQAFIKVKMI